MAKATRRKRRPVTSISKEKKAELISFYQLALQDLVAALTSSQVLESRRPRLNALILETDRILRELDAKAAAWSRAEIERLYRGNVLFVDGQIRGKGLTKEVITPEVSFAKVHVDAIQELITNPKTGLGPRLQAVSNKIRTDVRGFAKSHKVLQKQLKTFNRQLAQGALQGASAATIRNQILNSISGERTPAWMALQRFQSGLGPGGTLQTLANAPWLVKANGAKMHIFDHVQMTVLTRESETRNRARAARLVERGIELGQISPNPPLTPDACALYAGRIVALTPEAAEATGYPLIDRLPNGGVPFHPNCTHTLRGWFGDLEDEEDQAIAEQVGPGGGKTVRGGIPESALDKSWSDVQKGVRKKGFSSTVKQNPQVARANIPTSAGDEVREAIDEARGTTKRKEAVKPPPPAPEKPSISRPTRQAEEPLTAPPKPSSAPPKYDDKELRALVVDPKSSIDFKRVPHHKDYRVASRTAQREMLDSGLLGPKTKSKKLLTKLGYLNETGFQVDDFIRDIMNPRLSAPTKAGISAGELRRQFTKATGLKRGDIFSRERVSDTLRKLNGPVSPLHKEIQANATKEFKKAKDQVGSVYGKASKQAKNVAETERSFAKFLETINVAVLSTKMARIKWRQFKRGRAHASSRKNEIKLTASNWDENGLAPTHAHEFGHHIEFRNEDILERTRSFVEDRARLTSWRIHNMSWAEKRGTLELGWDDSFFDPYVGRIYTKKKSQRSLNKNPVLAGKDLSWTEVVSMGVESLESQVYLKKLLTEDPEHFALIWAILRGY